MPVTLREWLDLMGALDADLAFADLDAFYHLARTVLVKDERHFDRYDRAFGQYARGIARTDIDIAAQIPEDWLRQTFQRLRSDEERSKLDALSLEQLMEEFRKRLEEQKDRHFGGIGWIGTGGSSPFWCWGFQSGGDAGRGEGRRSLGREGLGTACLSQP